MYKEFKINVIYFIIIIFSVTSIKAQQVNTSYFIENSPTRHYFNPSFQPENNFYIGMPILGYSQFYFGNNSLMLKDVIYKVNGKDISFLDESGDKTLFYNTLKNTLLTSSNFQINLLDFGFRHKKSYWSFALSQKADVSVGLPKDLFNFLLFGTTSITSNVYDLNSLGFSTSMYTEAAFGYSKKLSDIWSIGGKLKLNYGNLNISSVNNSLGLSANIDEWALKGNGTINIASPVELNGTNVTNFNPTFPSKVTDYLKPAGLGAGIDLGVTVKPIKNLTISAAITDLGFINWYKNPKNIAYSVDFKYLGATDMTLNSDFRFSSIADSIIREIPKSVNDTAYSNAFTTYTTPKLNIGAEYAFLENKLSLGLLSRTMFFNKTAFEELTASVNGRPADWINMSLSYSIVNGNFSNIGAGLGLRTGIFHWFLSADYIPLNYSNLPATIAIAAIGTNDYNIPIPYKTNGLNLSFGVNLVFGNRKDADKDGVVDRKDKCPETPFGVIVDKKGCPVDTDGDGVPDYLDKCPNTPVEAYNKIDQNGCPVDTDKDSVPDYLDKCPDTPVAARKFVDKNGCELDTDKDVVPDYLDKCPDTPAGLTVDSVGCSIDTDKDGIPDYLDLCADTPIEAKGKVDQNGCPLDTDVDGVPDYLDRCPDTPFEARGTVDKYGCTPDTDGDGILDYLDKCPDTPSAARGKVDKNGCPLDTDGDGVPDYLDNCPKTPGLVSNNGCPEIKKEVKTLFQKALQGIQFESGKDVIMTRSYTILNQIAGVLIANPTYLIEIRGHTDNVGNSEMNQKLSQRRALSVKNHLVSKGVPVERMTTNGYGDTLPVAPNTTVTGRSQNRRVEFIVTFEEITFE